LQEAKLSSEIENIVTTQDALFRAAADSSERTDPQTREVLRYRAALRQGYNALADHRRTDIGLIIDLCRVLLDSPVMLRDTEPIIIEDVGAQRVVYTPPRGRGRIVELLQNLVDFLGQPGEIDPLIRVAVAHYQFEAIHPFIDGNGRTGRILNLLALIEMDLLEIPVIYLSRYIIRHKQEYYRRLAAVTEQGDWEGWLLYMLAAVEDTARWTTERIYAIRDLFEATIERAREQLPARVYSKELIELIFTQPYVRIQTVIDAGLAKRDAASEYLRELEKIGVLQREKRGREVLYRHPALLEALTG
jgi:Fic family protein